MTKLVRPKALFWALLIYLTSCSGDSEHRTRFPIFPKAENVQEFEFGSYNAYQIIYTVSAAYPDLSVAEFYSSQIKRPWVPCYGDMEWESFGDASRQPATFVHQILMHWANLEDGRLLLLGIRYISEGSGFRKVPDNSIQDVHLVEYREGDINESVKRLGLECERI